MCLEYIQTEITSGQNVRYSPKFSTENQYQKLYLSEKKREKIYQDYPNNDLGQKGRKTVFHLAQFLFTA